MLPVTMPLDVQVFTSGFGNKRRQDLLISMLDSRT